MDNDKRINLLKNLLKLNNLDGYLIPSFDEFQNEYSPECLQRLKWLTGFTGSNGLVLITLDKNYFFTDGRYITQANNQLGDNFVIYDMQNIDSIYHEIFSKIVDEYSIGYDPLIFTKKNIEYYFKNYLKYRNNIQLVSVETNLVDEIWKRDIKFKTKAPFILDAKYTSETEKEKIHKVLEKFNTDYLLITSPQSICWLLNIRGCNLECTPLIMAYCLVDKNGVVEIFSDLEKIKSNYKYIKLYPFKEIKKRVAEINRDNKTIKFDYSQAPIWFLNNFNTQNLVNDKDPCILLKSIKNKIEIAGFEYATIQDGIALTRLFNWLENKVNFGEEISEIDVDKKLLKFKSDNKLFKSRSFETISSFGKNSAVIHYNPYVSDDAVIDKDNLFLLDCGSQYEFGTTDVTRTFCFGNPSKEQKLHYTLVLKGVINLSTLIFPKKTTGSQIDVLARQFLWKYCLDYPHGTGHGVGHYLSVYEGPQGISKYNNQEIFSDMIITIEPGYYIPNQYGIRIENIVVVKENKNNKEFLQFETLTLAPIAYNLIDIKLLTDNEKKWLLLYHKKVYNSLVPFLDQNDKNYLEKYLQFYNKLT